MSTPESRLLPPERAHQVVLALCAVGVCLHQALLWSWYIEDSAISFSYARNLVSGEGLVPFPGGERVEGFSNPTWVALIAFFELFGVDGFTSSKWLGLLFGAACVPFTYALTRRALPEEAKDFALLAPTFLAFTSMFAIWNTCGLENSLYCFLLVGGTWQVSREMERESPPWSAAWFLALAASRPEGILYAAAAGGMLLFSVLRAKRSLRPVFGWLTVFWVPFLALLGLRLWYFAYPLPMTYYGKVGGGGTMLHRWHGWGWYQLRQYLEELGQAVFLPLYLFGMSGVAGWRGRAMLAVVVGMTLQLAIPGPIWVQELSFWPELPEPEWWLRLRVLLIVLIGAGLPFLPVGTARWEPRTAAGGMAVVSVFFHLYSNADWMIGYRWMSFQAATAAVPLVVGLYELGRWLQLRFVPQSPLPHRLVGALSGAVLLAWAAVNVDYTRWYAAEGKSEDPFYVQRRATYSLNTWRRLQLHDRPMTYMDHDMGGHMFWFHDTHKMVDIAGLIDVPRAMHNYGQFAFVDEYVFGEKRPDLIWMNKNWQGWTQFSKHELFNRGWFRMPPRGGPWGEDTGFSMRRDLLMKPAWTGTVDRKVNFAGGASLQGWATAVDEIAPGRSWYLEAGFKTAPRKPGEAYKVYAFLTDGRGVPAVWELPLGHGVLPMDQWRADEVFVGRFALDVPPEVRPGTYDLGFAVVGPAGQVLPAGGRDDTAYVSPNAVIPGKTLVPGPEGGEPAILRAAYARGEVRFRGVLQVVAPERIDALAEEHRVAAMQLADQGACAEAEAAWLRAFRAAPRNYPWQDQQRPGIGAALSTCWSGRAGEDPDHAVDMLARAHGWDHDAPAFLAASEPVADRLYAEGLAARSNGAWEAAYAAFSDVLSIQPTRSWARRYAEEARDKRLGYESLSTFGRVVRDPPPTPPKGPADKGAKAPPPDKGAKAPPPDKGAKAPPPDKGAKAPPPDEGAKAPAPAP